MKHEHKEVKDCEHKKIEHCKKCDVVECLDCGKEWKVTADYGNWVDGTYTYPNPFTNPDGIHGGVVNLCSKNPND